MYQKYKLLKLVVDLSLVKIEPCDGNLDDSIQTNLEQVFPKTETDNFVYDSLQSSFIKYE